MREGRAMRTVAWREMWPASVLAVVSALAVAVAGGMTTRPSASLLLGLLPAALYCGMTAGRGTPRTLAFLLARPLRRERLLLARGLAALVSIAFAWLLAVVLVVSNIDNVGGLGWFDPMLVGGLLVLAVACGAVGASATDHESLSLGIAVLVLLSLLTVPLFGPEVLDIPARRVRVTHPIPLLSLLVASTIGIASAAIRVWRDRLPLRDRSMIRALVTRCAGTWVVVQALCCVVVWRSASGERSTPLVVVGGSAHGPIVVSGTASDADGSNTRALDSVHIGLDDPAVVIHTKGLSALARGESPREVSHAVTAGGSLAVGLTDPETDACELAVGSLGDGELRRIDVPCGELSLSPSGASLAVEGPQTDSQTDSARTFFFVDAASGAQREEIDHVEQRVGWRGEELVTTRDQRTDRGGTYVGTTRISNVQYQSISPDGRRLAARFGSIKESMRVDVLDLATDETSTLLRVSGMVNMVGWLDHDHLVVAVHERDPGTWTLRILDAATAAIVVVVPVDDGGYEHIEGPLHGPWLVSRPPLGVAALAPDGTHSWLERTTRLTLDDLDVRRWAIDGAEVVGVGNAGVWRHPVPWEVPQ